jgi:hypothetical protein
MRGGERGVTAESEAECKMERVWEAVALGGVFGKDAARAAADLFVALHKTIG